MVRGWDEYKIVFCNIWERGRVWGNNFCKFLRGRVIFLFVVEFKIWIVNCLVFFVFFWWLCMFNCKVFLYIMWDVLWVKMIVLIFFVMCGWFRSDIMCSCSLKVWLVNLDYKWNFEGLVIEEEICFCIFFVIFVRIWFGDEYFWKE